MNATRFAGAAIAVWVVRVLLNWTFYTQVVGSQFKQIADAHPGIFREVIPAYIMIDLLFALVFVFLFAKVGSALGGGAAAGAKLGVIVAILSPVLGLLYQYFSFTFMPPGLAVTDGVFQVLAHAVEGAVAGLIYKTT